MIKSYGTPLADVMRSTQQFSITLPHEMAKLVRSKVTSGEYATESEVIRDGLRILLARDKTVETWLKNEVAPAYDANVTDPRRVLLRGNGINTTDVIKPTDSFTFIHNARTISS